MWQFWCQVAHRSGTAVRHGRIWTRKFSGPSTSHCEGTSEAQWEAYLREINSEIYSLHQLSNALKALEKNSIQPYLLKQTWKSFLSRTLKCNPEYIYHSNYYQTFSVSNCPTLGFLWVYSPAPFDKCSPIRNVLLNYHCDLLTDLWFSSGVLEVLCQSTVSEKREKGKLFILQPSWDTSVEESMGVVSNNQISSFQLPHPQLAC